MKKFLCSVLVFIMILSSFVLYSNAANASIAFQVSGSNITVGSQFTAILSVTSLGDLSGVNGVSGTLTYDSNYLEYVSMAPGASGYDDPEYRSSTGKFYILTQDMVLLGTGPSIAITFRLKAKPASSTQVATLSNVAITDGDQEIEFNPVSITLQVNEPEPPVNNTVTNTPVNNTVVNNTPTNNTVVNNTPTNNTIVNNTPGNNTINNTTDNSIINNTNPGNNTTGGGNSLINTIKNIITGGDNTTSQIKIPHAGFSTFIVLCIILTVVASVFAYLKYRKYKF